MYALLLLLTTCCCASALAKSVLYYASEDAHIHFEEFITKYNKQYTDANEKEARLEIFKKNLEDVNRLNKQSEHAVYGITEFMDFTPEEFEAKHTGLIVNDDYDSCDLVKTDKDIPNSGAPDSFDWRDQNAVTPVRNEFMCPSSYAFSAIGHVESQYFLTKKTVVIPFSVQQIIDCDTASHGCRGGRMTSAIKALMKLGGPMYEDDYYFTGRQQGDVCLSDEDLVVPKVQSCVSYNLRNQESVKQILYKVGPIAIGVRGVPLQRYTGRIITDTECVGKVNHGVLLVGYGTDNETNMDYWIVKNSWSIYYGEKGYFRMQRSNNSDGACGMINPAMVTAVVV